MSVYMLKQDLYCNRCLMNVGVRWVDADDQTIIRRSIHHYETPCTCNFGPPT